MFFEVGNDGVPELCGMPSKSTFPPCYLVNAAWPDYRQVGVSIVLPRSPEGLRPKGLLREVEVKVKCNCGGSFKFNGVHPISKMVRMRCNGCYRMEYRKSIWDKIKEFIRWVPDNKSLVLVARSRPFDTAPTAKRIICILHFRSSRRRTATSALGIGGVISAKIGSWSPKSWKPHRSTRVWAELFKNRPKSHYLLIK